MSVGKIVPVSFSDELPDSFLRYAKTVIRDRAVPDVRDGLKPVHRRIIYGMYELSMGPDKAYSKSARLVGHVLGSTHPHGDSAVYDAAVLLAQDWSCRYPFVDGHGNWGSPDGDSAAAMRYTEMRMTPLAMLMCRDLDKDTVNFRPNYDNRIEEPSVLPAPIPNLLLNGSTGIAVGLATNMAPHNLREVAAAIIKQIDEPKTSLESLMALIPGPDFPTGGYIIGLDGIKSAYATGRGIVIMRGKAQIESSKNGKSQIIISEIPYKVNKAKLCAKMGELARDKKIDGIAEVRDESDREGMRIVIEIKKDVAPEPILAALYKETQLQDSFGIINLVITPDGSPKILGLQELIRYFVAHRKEVVLRQTKYELKKAKERAHILQGLVIAVNNLDEVLNLIRAAKSPSIAKAGLIQRFELSEIQAQAVLDMKLQHLTGLELNGIKTEYENIRQLITGLEAILADERKVYAIIKKELQEIADKHGDNRRTVILEDCAKDELMVHVEPDARPIQVVLTEQGYIKRYLFNGRKVDLVEFKDGDVPVIRITTDDQATLLLFTAQGLVYQVAAKLLPEALPKEKGRPLINVVVMPENDKVVAIVPVDFNREDQILTFVTVEGKVKRTYLQEYANLRSNEAILLNSGDEVVGVHLTDGSKELVLATALGMAIRFNESEVNTQGRKAGGVKGMTCELDDMIVASAVIEQQTELLTVSETGWAKRTALTEFKPQGRAGKGIIAMKIDPKKGTGALAAVKLVSGAGTLYMIQAHGSLSKIELDQIPVEGRAKIGKPIVSVLLNDFVTKILD
ncbi:MAG: DNA gyrase subunit A [Peptococcaceae bacterium]|nr:DNA gyrase subunit A [Peptococcaceae bacterium]